MNDAGFRWMEYRRREIMEAVQRDFDSYFFPRVMMWVQKRQDLRDAGVLVPEDERPEK